MNHPATRVCVAALNIFSLSGCSEEYDDPAVAICETVLKASIGVADTSYERSSAEIDGATVHIAFSTGPLNTKPKPRKWSCEFELAGEVFTLAAPPSSEAQACSARIQAIAEEVKQIPPGMKARFKLEDEARACAAVIEKDALARIELIAKQAQLLSPLGIYPIRKEDTSLAASGK